MNFKMTTSLLLLFLSVGSISFGRQISSKINYTAKFEEDSKVISSGISFHSDTSNSSTQKITEISWKNEKDEEIEYQLEVTSAFDSKKKELTSSVTFKKRSANKWSEYKKFNIKSPCTEQETKQEKSSYYCKTKQLDSGFDKIAIESFVQSPTKIKKSLEFPETDLSLEYGDEEKGVHIESDFSVSSYSGHGSKIATWQTEEENSQIVFSAKNLSKSLHQAQFTIHSVDHKISIIAASGSQNRIQYHSLGQKEEDFTRYDLDATFGEQTIGKELENPHGTIDYNLVLPVELGGIIDGNFKIDLDKENLTPILGKNDSALFGKFLKLIKDESGTKTLPDTYHLYFKSNPTNAIASKTGRRTTHDGTFTLVKGKKVVAQLGTILSSGKIIQSYRYSESLDFPIGVEARAIWKVNNYEKPLDPFDN